MPTTYKIHPAIGVARVGDSPDEFFIGPERVNEYPDPPGGFKDGECRVKRQAARFRIFAHHDDGTTEEITDADAEITWTVHVANKKPAFTTGRPEQVIDPGPRTLTAANARTRFDGGTVTFRGFAPVEVPLGEMRTDDAGRLIVLGGHGRAGSPEGVPLITSTEHHPGWWDDISDGSVAATVRLRDTGETPPVSGAWVVTGPPKFAPQIDNVVTMYDALFHHFVDDGLLTAPIDTSYTDDVFPILQRAADTAWVEGLTSNHLWTHPVTAQPLVDAIFGRVDGPAAPPGGVADMPPLFGRRLTAVQYAHLQRWQAGTYARDWTGAPGPDPAISPAGLDRAALDGCCGGSFAPGVEIGGQIFSLSFVEPFRLDLTGNEPGDVTFSLGYPWQSDSLACGSKWWPVPRPVTVLTGPGGPTAPWTRGIADKADMVRDWSKLGFVVRQGSEHLEVDRCDTTSINLLTPALNFLDVPQAALGGAREMILPIVFEVIAPGGPVTLEYGPMGGPSHPQLTALNTSERVGPTSGGVAIVRLWVAYRTGPVGSTIPTQTLTVTEPVSGRSWEIEVDGNTVARRTKAVAFALDYSGSMSRDRGDGRSRHDALQQAANLFLDLMLEGDGAGIVRFNENADRLTDVVTLGDGMLSDTNRQMVSDAINGRGLDPDGYTSIGDGVFEARAALGDAIDTYDDDAVVVLTDGIENRARWIADVATEIDATTYAVGFGRPQDISVAALQALSGNTGGYLAVTGPITADNRFQLQKHFLQILADVNNAEVVLDPDGHLGDRQVIQIPFSVSDADSGIEVVLLTPEPKAIDFRLLSPMGDLIEPWMADHGRGIGFRLSDEASHYRLTLPFTNKRDRLNQEGTWQAIITPGEPRLDRGETDPGLLDPSQRDQRRKDWGQERRPTVPYSVVVHTYSDVSMTGSVGQRGAAPGTEIELRADVTQSGLRLDDVSVWAEITGPNGGGNGDQVVDLSPESGSGHRGRFVANEPGVHQVRLRAAGTTRAGVPFTRERLLSAQVWSGAGQPGDRASDLRPPADAIEDGPGSDHRWCDLLWCLAGPDGALTDALAERLAKYGIDIDKVWACLASCRDGKQS